MTLLAHEKSQRRLVILFQLPALPQSHLTSNFKTPHIALAAATQGKRLARGTRGSRVETIVMQIAARCEERRDCHIGTMSLPSCFADTNYVRAMANLELPSWDVYGMHSDTAGAAGLNTSTSKETVEHSLNMEVEHSALNNAGSSVWKQDPV